MEIKEEIVEARHALVTDWGKIEHEYYSSRQKKETEIARLDALMEAKRDILKQDENTANWLKGILEVLVKGKNG